MNLLLQRDPFLEAGTTGSLSIDGKPFCVTLEDPDAQFKPLYCCISPGIYVVKIYHSVHLNADVPLLIAVPNRTFIEMHWGNWVRNFKGCIGVGDSKSIEPGDVPAIWNTKLTFYKLFPLIEDALPQGVSIEVRNYIANPVTDPEIGM